MTSSSYDYAILGIGKTGVSCAKFLEKMNANYIIMDTRTNPPEFNNLVESCKNPEYLLGKIDTDILKKTNTIVISPGISIHESYLSTPEILNKIIGDIELFFRYKKANTILVTGTNGKGTVCSLVEKILKENNYETKLGGNIGIPILDLLHGKEPDFYIIEMSSFQLLVKIPSLNSVCASITGVTVDHMDWHRNNFPEYVNAKQNIYANSKTQVWNRDNILTKPNIDIQNGNSVSFGLSPRNNSNEYAIMKNKEDLHFLLQSDEIICNVKEINLFGEHNYLNILNALAICKAVGVDHAIGIQAIKNFKTLKHRCELVYTDKNQVLWYDDSKATNVDSTLQAIKSIANKINDKIILIAGGIAKNSKFDGLKEPIKTYVKKVYLFGIDATIMFEDIKGPNVPIEMCESLQECVEKAKITAVKGDAVLLSPACASMDMFKNAEERGDMFAKYAKSE